MTGEGSSFVQPAIPRFDDHYDHWSMLMENFLRSKENWGLVENGITSRTLFQAIDRAILETILKKDTAKDIWDSMKKKYQGMAKVKCAQLQALHKEFEMLNMKVEESVDEYFGRNLTMASKRRINGEKLEDVAVIENILRSMTPKFDYVVCSIEESKDLDNLSIDELQSSLLVHEKWMNSHAMKEQALKVSQENHSPRRRRGRGQGGFRGCGRGCQGSFDKSNVECYYYHEMGHFQ
ncbi:unnamed protein product [Prunus armeniaca]